jgi:Rps23 Pro-64 3,4-dihydroxylase Tpa1-like proline 4-hydroxylase
LAWRVLVDTFLPLAPQQEKSPTMEFINTPYRDLMAVAKQYKQTYITNPPFPNIAFESFFNPEMLEEVLAEFPDLSKGPGRKMDNQGQVKLATKGTERFGPATMRFVNYLNSEEFINFLQELTSIEEKLIPDPEFLGGGLHEIKRGGYLKLHADFNKNSKNQDRRLNILIYLNKDWKDEYGGHFELWNRDLTECVKKIRPDFNTLAMFSTTDFSYHGHPDPLNCPEHMSRKSLALYYYSNGRPDVDIDHSLGKHSTLWVGRKGRPDEQNITEKKQTAIGKFFKKLFS